MAGGIFRHFELIWLDRGSLIRGWMGCSVCQRGLIYELAAIGSASWRMSLLKYESMI